MDNHLNAPGFTLWFTGLPGAGKSTLARALASELTTAGGRVEILDGDEVRQTLSKGLGFSRADRETNMQRIGYVARLLARNGVGVLVAAIAPYREAREAIRRAQEAPFVEVYVECAMEELIRRDPKGLYAQARRGELAGLTGVSDLYEPPLTPDIHVHTDRETVDQSVAAIVAFLRARDLVRAPSNVHEM
jgi:adenylyl-sulfate kinase